MKPKLLIADKHKNIFDAPFLGAAGAKAGAFFALQKNDLIKLPFGSELFILPGRQPVGYNPSNNKFETLQHNPYKHGKEKCFAVAAFISPGYTATYTPAYIEEKNAGQLPLFSYAAVCFYKGALFVPAIRVDRQRRHDLRLMPVHKVKRNIKKFQNQFKKNRLFQHLIRCALEYNCPNGKNFFLQRCECPLPVSPSCNARCKGCISFQNTEACPATQPRIKFIPTSDEISQIALFHIKAVKNPIVSFGQGCEGEPLMQVKTLLSSIKLIREKTQRGTINLNTNASRPYALKELFDAGLDSIRVSLNSAQEKYYNAYYRPSGYSLKDVASSIILARKLNKFVSINYLTMPGFTDQAEEVRAMLDFLKKTRINMIQWRNLNYDPAAYSALMKLKAKSCDMMGIKETMRLIKTRFPKITFGYFNPHTKFLSSS